jgi:hypothetical protein
MDLWLASMPSKGPMILMPSTLVMFLCLPMRAFPRTQEMCRILLELFLGVRILSNSLLKNQPESIGGNSLVGE